MKSKASKIKARVIHHITNGISAGIGCAAAPFVVSAIASRRAKRVFLAAAPVGVVFGGGILCLGAMTGIIHLAHKIPSASAD